MVIYKTIKKKREIIFMHTHTTLYTLLREIDTQILSYITYLYTPPSPALFLSTHTHYFTSLYKHLHHHSSSSS